MFWLALTLIGFSLSYAAPEAPETKILILYADTPTFLPYTIFTDAFKNRIAEIDSDKTSYYYEYLAWSQHATDPTYAGDVSVFLHQKYRKDKPNLVILVGGSAAQFFLSYGERMFPGVPKVIVGVTGVGYSKTNLPQNFSVLQSLYDESKIIETILQIQPATKRIYVLIGNSAAEQRTVTSYSLNFKRFVDKVEIIYLNQLPFNKLLEFVPTVKGDAVFLFHVFFQDVEGRAFVPSNVLRRISQVARVPIYGVQDTFLGAGAVGGYVNSTRLMGLRTAEQMAAMRAGNKPAGSTLITTSTGEYVFDWRELKRWGIAVDRLPVGSRIEFREPNVWEMHKWLILGVVFIIITQGTLIFGLVVYSVKIKKATNELLRSKEALRQSDERIRLFFERQLVGMAITSPEKGWLQVNNKLSEMLGYLPEELSLLTWAELTHPDDLAADVVQFNRILSGEIDHYALEKRFISKDGAVINTNLSVGCVRRHDGSVDYVLALLEDITERKHAEAELRKSEEKYRLIAENTADLISVLDMNLHFTYVSPASMRLRGYTAEEAMQQTLDQVLTPESMKLGLTVFEKEMQLEASGTADPDRTRILELEEYKKDGSTIWLEVNLSFLRNKDHKPVAILIVSRDITERKRLEEESSRLASVIKHSRELVNLATPNGTMFFLNDTGKKMLGISEEEVTQTNIMNIIPEHLLDKVRQEVLPSIAENGYWEGDLQYSNLKTGALTDVHAITYKIADPATGVLQFMANVSIDITERKRAEDEKEKLQAQLGQAQKMEAIGQLAGGVAHDFNNMLNVILGYSQLALMKIEPSSPLKADLQEIMNATQRSTELVRQLLAFARKQTIAPKVLDLNDTVAGMLNMLQRLIGEDIDLLWMPAAKLWPVKMDPTQVDQILANLAVNARDSISGVGKITIETGKAEFDAVYCAQNAGFVPGHYVMLAVSDNGCGMDQETCEKIFEPFFTTKEIGKGTGMGLATVYGIVKQNNWFINVYSEPGKGTTFKIYIPMHGKGEMAIDEPSLHSGPLTGTETLLLVEDDAALLKMAETMLKGLGYTVLTAGTPGEAIRLAGEHAGGIHLMLTDVIMPEMSGRDLQKHIITVRPGIKCMFMSGYTANVIAHHGVLDEGVNFLQKPFNMEGLSLKVREALDRE